MTYVGIDVSKDKLDLAILSLASGKVALRRFPNTERGRAALLRLLVTRRPQRLVLEASGVYHLPILRRLAAAGLPVALANPYQVAAFRKASGARNKTDRKDAVLLARYASVYQDRLAPYTPPPKAVAELKEVLTYREQLSAHLRQVNNQIEAARWKQAQGSPSRTLAWLQEEKEQIQNRLEAVESEIERLLRAIPESRVLLAQKGVGLWVAATVLAFLPPNLWGKPKRASAYAGLIPEQTLSGSSVRKSRLSKRGPALLRKQLFMAAWVAVRHDPEMAAFYHRLLSNNKKKKQALVAVAHKILRQLMGKLKASYRKEKRRKLAA